MSATTAAAPPRAAYLPALAAIAVGLAAWVAMFWPECRAAYRVWNDSTAYGHCFLVVPIALYLAWDRRESLIGLLPRAAPRFALLALPLPLAWLAADRLGIMEGRQLVAIAVLEVLCLSVLGWRLFRALSGPLLYLFFLVPFGAFLTPALQTVTAGFIEVGLQVLGIPHFVNDMIIEISAGTFFVAEACAGLRFLIASIAFGVFFALLNYNRPGRRAAFIAASIIVPIIANGLRALGIVVLGSILGSAEAAAADHLIYGWFFFSFVTLLLVAAGLPFREAPPGAPERSSTGAPVPAYGFAAPLLAVLAVAGTGPAAGAALDHSARPARLASRPALVAPEGCQLSPADGPSPDVDRAVWAMSCAARSWTVTVQALPPRSTGAALAEARRRLIGPIDQDDVMNNALTGAPGWQVTMTHNPLVVVGTTAWVDGAPARGGLVQRLSLARNSIVGTDKPPVVIAVSYRAPEGLPDNQTNGAVAELERFVAAQPDLAAAIATSGPAP